MEGIAINKKNEKEKMTVGDIEKLLKYDLPEGDNASKNLIDLINNSSKTNAVELKKNSHIKG